MGLIRTFRRDLKSLPKYNILTEWILRLALFVFVLINYGRRLSYLDFSSEYFILAVFYFIFSFLIIVGGFAKTSELTRFAAVIMLIVIVSHLAASILVFRKLNEYYSTHLLFFAITMHFATSSKKNDFYYRSRFESDSIDIEEEANRLEPSDSGS